MSAPIIPPGVPTALSPNGNIAPTDNTSTWQVTDNYNSDAVVASSAVPNGWSLALDSSNPRKLVPTPPANAAQGGDPNGTGRYKARFSAAGVAAAN